MTLDCTAVIDLCPALGRSGAQRGVVPRASAATPPAQGTGQPEGRAPFDASGRPSSVAGGKPRSVPRSYPRAKIRSVTVVKSDVIPL